MKIKAGILAAISLILLFSLSGCWKREEEFARREISNIPEDEGEEDIKIFVDEEPEAPAQPFRFVDVEGQEYETEINTEVEMHSYDWEGLVTDGYFKYYYQDEELRSKLGIDVSKYQPEIDWEKVAAAGIEFAFLRLGYRGYGSSGSIYLDPYFESHFQGARSVGIEIGVYFFSQAITEAEALEEAEFVISHLNGRFLELPVVFDPEEIRDDQARTDGVSGEQFTRNAVIFCDRLQQAGYEPMIYANMLWEAFVFDLEELSGYAIWYADYEEKPQTPYHFKCWQYTEKGYISGIDRIVDLNIWID